MGTAKLEEDHDPLLPTRRRVVKRPQTENDQKPVVDLRRRDLPLQPPPSPEAFARVGALDRMRGFALIGAFVVNLAVFCLDAGAPRTGSRVEDTVFKVVGTLTDGKWFTVFSFVFGYSLAMQLRGRDPLTVRRQRTMRRLLVLGALGVAHGLLLYRWDVLFAYAVLGVVVYAMRQFSTRGLAIWAVASVSFGSWLATEDSISPEGFRLTRTFGADAIEIYQQGSLGDVIALHVRNHAYNVVQEVLMQWPFVLGMMLLGVIAERHLFFSVGVRHRMLRRCAMVIGLASFAWNLLSDFTEFEDVSRVTRMIGMFAVLGQSLATIEFLSRPRIRANSLIVAFGRMSLTNYLVQSLVCTTLLFGYGLNLGSFFTIWVQLVFAGLFISAQAIGSRWWLRRHARGPMEALVHGLVCL